MKSGNKPVFGYQGQSSISSEQGAGLTKREYFAAMAMQGLLSSRSLQEALNADRMNWAEFAVSQADALLAELEKPI